MTHQIRKASSRYVNRLLAGIALCTAAAVSNAAALPTQPGWYALPSTTLKSVCIGEQMGVGGNEGCSGIVEDWSGGIFDAKRNRLLVWGGGHAGYMGNEVYAVNLGDQTIKRLYDPSTNAPKDCTNTGIMPDGKPVSRHTYNHITYIAHADKMFAYGGSGVPCGWLLGDTWTLDLATLTWTKMNSTGDKLPPDYGYSAAYDPATKKVYIANTAVLWSYTLETDTYKELSNADYTSYYMTGVIDTKRHLFVQIGDGYTLAYNIAAGSNYARQTWTTTGANAIVKNGYPGLAYDPITDRIVAWDGGDTVYLLNPDTKVWTTSTLSGGPGAAVGNGTFGRFQYSQESNAFVLVNKYDQNAYVLKLNSNAGSAPAPVEPPPATPPPPPPPSTPPPSSGGSDFAARCAAAGVLRCNGFDQTSDLGSGLYPASDGVIRASIDTSIKASGTGSLKFTIPASGSANAAGSWATSFGQNFGENSTFYVQFRQRLSPEMMQQSNGGGGFKQVIFHHSSSTCAGVEITTNNGFWRGFPQMYSRCGNDPWDKDLGNGDFLLQTGADYQCHYQSPQSRTPPCGYYHTNEWLTFYYRVSIGTWGQPNSLVQAWMGYDGGALKQFINEQNLTLVNDGGSTLYNTLTFLPYDTGRTSAASSAATWYDDLIISTQPIAAPGQASATILPSPPTNVTVH